MAVDRLPGSHEKDFELLRSAGRGRLASLTLRLLVGAIFLAFIGVLTLIAAGGPTDGPGHFDRVQGELRTNEEPLAFELFTSIESYDLWLAHHGTQTERNLFQRLAVRVGESSLDTIAVAESGNRSWLGALNLAVQSGALRLGFLILASCRFWLVVFMGSIAYGFTRYEPYRGNDVLGQTGNGRVFYSGIRAALSKVSSSGAPDVQIRGLACPQLASPAEVRATSLWRTLVEFQADNGTNQALCGVILQSKGVSTFVARAGDDAALEESYSGSTLGETTELFVRAALSLHADYRSNQRIEEDAPTPQGVSAGFSHKQTPTEYAVSVQEAFHRVLTPEMRRCIANLCAAEIATTILAFESGKVLSYVYEGGRWTRKSNFEHLNARAVLHSLLQYPDDYSFELRALIRRALIYASRRSAFAPVRMPIDLTPEEWALRQWVEVLLACPHELQESIDDIELAGLVREGHERWVMEFFDHTILVSPHLTSLSFATPYNLLFVPFTKLIEVLRRTLSASQVQRLHALAAIVSSRQQRQIAQSESSDEPLPTFDRILPPLSAQEIESLCSLHGLRKEDVEAWSALRLILTGYSWLGRRVGDYTVPDSSIIFAVFNVDAAHTEANALGLIGRTGMVTLRGGKIEERLGHSWSARFIPVHGATMAESQEDFEKLMKGIKETVGEVLGAAEPVV